MHVLVKNVVKKSHTHTQIDSQRVNGFTRCWLLSLHLLSDRPAHFSADVGADK